MLTATAPVDLDDGPRTARSGRERMCAVTRQVQPIEELIRFVVGPDGEVVPDLKCKLPGRGLWVSASRDTLAEAIRRGVFGRGFKREVRVSPDLVALTDALLVRGAVEALAMAGKAGEVVAGFTKVEAALGAGQAAMLLHASNGAADGIRKLDAIARQNTGETAPFPILCALTSAELDLALGRSNVIHAALRAGPAVRTVLDRCRSVLRFRATPEQRANKAAATTIAATTTSRLKDAPTGRPQD
ncbi:RNA-binding protein [Bradyrhizobium sp. U87765 SZCCT0131]|uniref:RNA-binding protein n=1 Tax=unclassified Bradyrhizobium TaxID=2631580 RepID=UPI001BA7CDD6|nr:MULTISPECIES: RNA-binding protein [unclassified Bradyrhizobium]MBR1216675.1 RNA-binding protein [Bradyrhizobium sp. U87765 SZCCT0131]MBR1259569.1 RNA-binding protein [Bradyrhizobium sp. U87765 SZCCT0134]MBR1305710.1 RNA-binding protein [Bradyrhizobium sp. U87765 SZCCT0110]MBR1322077.1 RNA-binding protein [Bradyrhizobium sp. U87765 SZCCT0109]MBR1350645.1 RNA-binding protein [Bradyrhizobium sp. U87765 SZCCT0048]